MFVFFTVAILAQTTPFLGELNCTSGNLATEQMTRVWELVNSYTRPDPDFDVAWEGQGDGIVVICASDNKEYRFAQVKYWHCSCYDSSYATYKKVHQNDELDLSKFQSAEDIFQYSWEDLKPIAAELIQERAYCDVGPIGLKVLEGDFDVRQVREQNTFLKEVIEEHDLVVFNGKFFKRDSLDDLISSKIAQLGKLGLLL